MVKELMERCDLCIGNTDHDWFEFLSARSDLEEVNFWQPSPRKFRVMNEGGIFFFRRKSPINKIGGFGILASTDNASIGLLWDDLGVSNGVETEEEFIERVKRYRKTSFVDRHTQVGFKILVTPVFLRESDWFDLPSDWSANIVTGKGYSSSSDAGKYLMDRFSALAAGAQGALSRHLDDVGLSEIPQAGFTHGVSRRRTGQRQFQINIIASYAGRCAVTGCTTLPVLEAAHLLGFAESLDHSSSNGILLRRDIHALLDCGFISFDESYRVRITKRFIDSGNPLGEYSVLNGRKLYLPDRPAHWPSLEAIAHLRATVGPYIPIPPSP